MKIWKFKKRIEIDKKIGNFNIHTFHYGGFDKKGKHKNWTELHCWYECDCEDCPLSWEERGYEDVSCGCYMAESGEDCPETLLICMLPRWIKNIIYKKYMRNVTKMIDQKIKKLSMTDTEDECMMQAWYETLGDACKEYRGRCEECPLQCHEEPPELDW